MSEPASRNQQRTLRVWRVGARRRGLHRRRRRRRFASRLARRLASQLARRLAPRLARGRLRLAVSGGAPISKDTLEFAFCALAPMMQGYGATETFAGATLTNPWHGCLFDRGGPRQAGRQA